MITDFRENHMIISPVVINDQAVEVVQQYRHVGNNNVICDKLTVELHVDTVCDQHVYFYHRFQRFFIESTVTKVTLKSIIIQLLITC